MRSNLTRAQQARSMTGEQLKAFGEQLRRIEMTGDMGQAYRLLQRGSAADAATMAMYAGHSVLSTKSAEFWQHLQEQVAQACRHLCDGFELRKRRERTGAARNG